MGVIFHSAPRYAANDSVLDAVAPGLGEALLSSFERHGELCLVVRRESVAEVLRQLRDGHAYQQLMEIAGADYPERAERFEVVYHLLSLTANHRLRIKCSTDEATPVPTVTHLWPNAGWLEREVYDMFGVLFEGNPDLRRILTDYGFRGHPFRKDFPLTGHVEMRYSEEEKRVVYEPVQLPQDFRNFDFTSPWEGADYVLPGDEKASPPASPGDPKVTEKPGDTGAGAKTDAKAAERQSAGSPAQENGGKDVPPPAPTSGGAGGDRSKDAR